MREIDQFMADVSRKNAGQEEFLQAVREAAEALIPFIRDHPEYAQNRILQRLTEPDRIIVFRVTWKDDDGKVQINRGYRVQHSNAIGPYKGGLRFDPSVDLSILKFLAFEQVFKNSLTTLPMGGAKGGSDFNPKGRSDNEIMRFCQAFMTELHRHIGASMDVPAGDIGVGQREIGYLFGQYKRLANQFTGVLTGKGPAYGGSLIRTEATGFGCVYFARQMLQMNDADLEGMKCLVSGSGNVALHAAQKLLDFNAEVLTLSDRSGFVHFPEGLSVGQLQEIKSLKTTREGNLHEYAEAHDLQFYPDEWPWAVPCDAAFPCATQNEITKKDAETLVNNDCRLVAEGANMPATYEAAKLFEKERILYAPGKAANAGGVAISGLEMSQNAIGISWTREQVDSRLRDIMHDIHERCVTYGKEDGFVNYVKGANIGGFVKVADAMLAYGTL